MGTWALSENQCLAKEAAGRVCSMGNPNRPQWPWHFKLGALLGGRDRRKKP